jgi:hypothetical protein
MAATSEVTVLLPLDPVIAATGLLPGGHDHLGDTVKSGGVQRAEMRVRPRLDRFQYGAFRREIPAVHDAQRAALPGQPLQA